MNKQKLIHELFIGKVADKIGFKKTLELLSESNKAINKLQNETKDEVEVIKESIISLIKPHVKDYEININKTESSYFGVKNDFEIKFTITTKNKNKNK